ncbi:hypothetical protein [Ramlibacter ginsenosidimutans]|uniref:hypothetical protein n=1 Tax=Ramlibacter ginsenosidimutans TaxID=502333 RepID=UPI001F5C4730|nr:hypothetical protein [Ramlibacter ginsenosidimutans]
MASQGRGRSINTAELYGYRGVSVGNAVLLGVWRTFHEFLWSYLWHCFGGEWREAEEKKPEPERHVLLRWESLWVEQMSAGSAEPRKTRYTDMTGAGVALQTLAYNLYLLKHNAELQRRLIDRLKHRDQFNGAYYEAMVASWCILAGFKLTLLDEVSGKSRNCEFNATAPSGRVFAVEAKARQPGKAHTDVGNQLVDALRKHTEHERIVFIELSSEDIPSKQLVEEVSKAIRGREALTLGGKPAPAAYVCVTNHPYHQTLTGTAIKRLMVAEGFKVPDFGTTWFPTLIEQFKAEQRHAEVLALRDAFKNYQVPATFDGEVPEVAFGQIERRWLIGEQYDLNRFGLDCTGLLEFAYVDEESAVVELRFRLREGDERVFQDSLSAMELAAYRHHPQSFFGALIDLPPEVDTPFDLFKAVYNDCKMTRSQILEFCAAAPDLARLGELPEEELRLEFCDRYTRWLMHNGFLDAETDAGDAEEAPPSDGARPVA